MAKGEPLKSRWQDAQERWEATLRMWDVEDQGGYLEVVRRELDGPTERHLIWSDSEHTEVNQDLRCTVVDSGDPLSAP